jgi:phosphoglycolate phosphatase-like HAD superfamily hydrolase
MVAKRALILDLDGTLVDTVYAHEVAWQQALEEAGAHAYWAAQTWVLLDEGHPTFGTCRGSSPGLLLPRAGSWLGVGPSPRLQSYRGEDSWTRNPRGMFVLGS